MTIGIAISGPRAGLAAFGALRAVEAVGRGAIAGFVSFVVISPSGKLVSACTQDAGTTALFGGGEPPADFAEAELAALMSSGPNRPEPLVQFTPGDAEAGLVTGHRLPNLPCSNGEIPNRVTLARLSAGAAPEDAVAAGLALDPEADAGLIAMDTSGRIAMGNSRAVARRDDLGDLLVEDDRTGLRIAVMHNSIFPHRALAELAAVAAVDAVAPIDRVDRETRLRGISLVPGAERCLHLDAEGVVREIAVLEAVWLGRAWEGSPVHRGDPVRQEGRIVGYITREVYAIAREGSVVGTRGSDAAGWRLV